MTHQLLPRHGHAPDADECIALADFWLDEAVRTFTNEATRAICINEAQHWLDLAEDIRLVDANQTRREAAALAGALSAELKPASTVVDPANKNSW